MALVELGICVHRFAEIAERRDEDPVWVPKAAARRWVILTTDRGRQDRIMRRQIHEHRAIGVAANAHVSNIGLVGLLVEHGVLLQRTLERNQPPLLLYLQQGRMTAYDFEGGRRVRIMGNGKIKWREPVS